MAEPMEVSEAHRRVLEHIEAGRGAWHGAERPKQRGHRSGLLTDLKCHGLIDWMMEGEAARYFVTDAGKAALAGTTGESK